MRLVGKIGPADAHDAGVRCGLWDSEARLMLMMLGVGALVGKKGPAYTHESGREGGLCERE